MPFVGELAAIGTSLCFSIGSTFFTLSGRELGSVLVNRIRLVIAVLLVMLLHTLTFGQPLPVDAGSERWFWLGLSGFVGLALGDAFLLQSFVLVGPRLAMLMMALAPVLSVILAWLFLGEALPPEKIVAILITIGGIMVVVSERSAPSGGQVTDSRRYVIGLLCGLGGAAGQAGGLVLSKMGLQDGFPALSGNLIRLLVAMVLVWALALVNRQVFSNYRTAKAKPRALLMVLGGTILGPVMGVWLSLIAVQNANVGVASTLSSLMPIFLIPISYIAFRERVTRQAVIGTIIAFVGVVLLFV